jgi:hypothetical protein
VWALPVATVWRLVVMGDLNFRCMWDSSSLRPSVPSLPFSLTSASTRSAVSIFMAIRPSSDIGSPHVHSAAAQGRRAAGCTV